MVGQGNKGRGDGDPTEPVKLDDEKVISTETSQSRGLTPEKDPTLSMSAEELHRQSQAPIKLGKAGLATGPEPAVSAGEAEELLPKINRVRTEPAALKTDSAALEPLETSDELQLRASFDETIPFPVEQLQEAANLAELPDQSFTSTVESELPCETQDNSPEMPTPSLAEMSASLVQTLASPALKSVTIADLPQSTQSLIANVELNTPHLKHQTAGSLSDSRPVLGSLILLGPLSPNSNEVHEYENVLEIRSIAAPRRAILRRALHTDRTEDYHRIFVAEAELARQITHPNIVKTYQSGGDRGIPFLVREYVMGRSLQQLRVENQNFSMNLVELAALALQVIGALNALHKLCDAQGELFHFIHGALNPSSILIGQNARVRITEPVFCRFDGRALRPSQLTRKQDEAYLAPEERADLLASSAGDWYALGLVMAELILGRERLSHSFVAGNLDLSQLRQDLLSEVDISEELIEAWMGVLDSSHERRFNFVEMLENGLRAVTVQAETVDEPQRVLAHLLKSPLSEPAAVDSADSSETIDSRLPVTRAQSGHAGAVLEDTPLLVPPRGTTRETGPVTPPNYGDSSRGLPWHIIFLLLGGGAVLAFVFVKWLQ